MMNSLSPRKAQMPSSRPNALRMDQANPKAPRRRRVHRKSRLGCSNCKQLSVKCDEARPTCTRCCTSGRSCNYTGLPLPPDAESICIDLCAPTAVIFIPAARLYCPVFLPTVHDVSGYQMQAHDWATLERFMHHTVATLGDRDMRAAFAQSIPKLISHSPFLLHIILAISRLHDVNGDHLSSPPSFISNNRLILNHCYHGTALFRQKMSRLGPAPDSALPDVEQDSLLAAATLLAMASFATIGDDDGSDIWPLGQSKAEDLAWLRMGLGGSMLCQMTDLAKRQSCFTAIHQRLQVLPPPDGTAPIHIHSLPQALSLLFPDLAQSTSSSNPYHAVLSILSQLYERPISDENFYDIFSLLNFMQPEYHALLATKDLRALLLLAFWFAQIAPGNIWWLKRRCVLQGLAVCKYIEASPSADASMIELLSHPRAVLRRFDNHYMQSYTKRTELNL